MTPRRRRRRLRDPSASGRSRQPNHRNSWPARRPLHRARRPFRRRPAKPVPTRVATRFSVLSSIAGPPSTPAQGRITPARPSRSSSPMDNEGVALSRWRVTLSISGLVPMSGRSDTGLGVNLVVSPRAEANRLDCGFVWTLVSAGVLSVRCRWHHRCRTRRSDYRVDRMVEWAGRRGYVALCRCCRQKDATDA